MRIYKWALLGLVALLVGCGEEKPTREESNAAIEMLGGRFSADGKSLDFFAAEITDAGLVHLEGLTGLEVMNLPDVEITDAGLVHLEGLTGLRRLILDGTKITDAGLVHLEGLTGLKSLDIIGTKVTDAGVAKLEAALPGCNILR